MGHGSKNEFHHYSIEKFVVTANACQFKKTSICHSRCTDNKGVGGPTGESARVASASTSRPKTMLAILRPSTIGFATLTCMFPPHICRRCMAYSLFLPPPGTAAQHAKSKYMSTAHIQC
ncbi:hypothetical protein TcasGA2_TC013285 [Tribolium castaneum]|uniref:Uncharacterized protein n=1 Tax=Tribolium castaneum TaxID=7070 RepID=D6WP33_TRICA|nr:hypothetical protein TcasGA2_TC013285 [Tribolium castaneum]